jgi:exoribonuclease R
MRLDDAAAAAMRAGLDRIRAELHVPDGFPADVLQAARDAAERSDAVVAEPGRADRTDLPMVTLDPEGSIDLDQAFALDSDGDDVLLRYAIADVAAFVAPGSLLETEAWSRGVTIYLPDRRAPLYPTPLSEGAVSLLPDGDRPAVLFTVRVGRDGEARLDAIERAVVRSRAKLAYETVERADLPEGLDELAARVNRAEVRRGASRVDFPEQVVRRDDDGGYVLEFRPRRWAEEWNATMSLATNLAVAALLLEHGTGLFRVMADVDERAERRLRHTARAFGLTWPADVPLAAFQRSLPHDDPRTSAFLLAVRRAGGGASYAPPTPGGPPPWHAAMATTYAHVTAPLRRLQDRYVIDAALALSAGRPVAAETAAAFERLPAVMERAETRAAQADREALDLAEAVVLHGREGHAFDAVVTDRDDRGTRIQIVDPPIVARVAAHGVEPGDPLRVRVAQADPVARRIELERVG